MTMKKHIFQSILVALALTTATLAAQAQDTPKTKAELQTMLNTSTTFAGDLAIERLATLSAAAGTLSEADFNTIDAEIVSRFSTKAGTTGYGANKQTWSGTRTADRTISSNTVAIVDGTYTMSKTITVNSGYTLVVLPAETGGSINSTGHKDKGSLFTTNGGTILLKGRSKNVPLVIDGGIPTHPTDPKAFLTDNYDTYKVNTGGNQAVLVYMNNTGSLRSTYTTFQNNWRWNQGSAGGRTLNQGNALSFYGNGSSKFQTCGFYGCKFINLWNMTRNIRGAAVGTENTLFNTDFNIASVEPEFTLGGLLFNNCEFDSNLSALCHDDTGCRVESLGRRGTNVICAGGAAIGCEAGGKKYNLMLNNSTFKNNWSGWFGGAVFWNNTSKVFINGCTFDHNTSGLGGAVYLEGNCTIKNSTFTNNAAKQINHPDDAYGNGNGFDGCGGAVYVRSCNEGSAPSVMCRLDLIGDNVFENNTADLDGGAMEIYLDEGSGKTELDYTVKLDKSGGKSPQFNGNTAGRCGGGIAVVESPTLFGKEGTTYTITSDIQFNAGEVSGNTAAGTKSNDNTNVLFNEPGDGGGIYAEYMNLAIGDDFIITDNKAANNGGGIYSRGNSTYGNIEVGGATIEGNQAQAKVTIADKIKVGTSTGASNGTYGTQQGNGGAICVSGGSFTMTGGVLGSNGKANTAKGNGGCVFANNGAIVTLSGGTVSYNEATLNGGGFFVNNGTVTLSGGDISHNEALNGGGLYLTNAAHMTISNGLLTNNKATSSTKWPSGNTANGKSTATSTENAGVGGGIYLAPGTGTTDAKRTMLTFNVTGSIGIYNNEATNAADDIFADQTNTAIIIPEVQFMNLTGLSRKADGWYEDYATDDSGYDVGFNNIGTSGDDVLRYRDAIDTGENIWKQIVDESTPGTTNKFTNKYIALTLGISMGNMTINATGIKPGESIVVTVERPMQNGDNPTNYAKNKPSYSVTLTGDADGKATAKLAGLPVGWYELVRTPWAWAYSDQGEYKATSATATSGDDIVQHLGGKAGSEPIDKNIGSTATDGKLAADVNYKSTTYGFFKVEPIEPQPLNGDATINNKFVTTTP